MSLSDKVMKSIDKHIDKMEVEIECSECGKKFAVKKGYNKCPHCSHEVDVSHKP